MMPMYKPPVASYLPMIQRDLATAASEIVRVPAVPVTDILLTEPRRSMHTLWTAHKITRTGLVQCVRMTGEDRPCRQWVSTGEVGEDGQGPYDTQLDCTVRIDEDGHGPYDTQLAWMVRRCCSTLQYWQFRGYCEECRVLGSAWVESDQAIESEEGEL